MMPDLNDPTCIQCGDPLTEDEKVAEFKHNDGLCETCRQNYNQEMHQINW